MVKKYLVRIILILTSFIILLAIPKGSIYLDNIGLYIFVLTLLFTIFKPFKGLKVKRISLVLKNYLFGILSGTFILSLIIGILYLTNNMTFSINQNKDLLFIIYISLFWMVQSFFEEYLIRSVFFDLIGRELGYIFAIIGSALIFTLLHVGNSNLSIIPIVNIFLFGLLAGYLVKIFKNIYFISGFHFIWNYLQGNIFGIKVSGIEINESLLISNIDKNNIFNGGNFGVEGSIFTLIVFVAIISIILIIRLFKNKNKIVNYKEFEDLYLSKTLDNVFVLSQVNEDLSNKLSIDFVNNSNYIFLPSVLEKIKLNFNYNLAYYDKLYLIDQIKKSEIRKCLIICNNLRLKNLLEYNLEECLFVSK